jgi:polysaccharide export outer membrane protein
MFLNAFKVLSFYLLRGAVLVLALTRPALSQVQADTSPSDPPQTAREREPERVAGYLLGPDDSFVVLARSAEEVSDTTYRVDSEGYVTIPLIGRVRVTGLTRAQLEDEVTRRLGEYIRNPLVSITVTEFQSQPVTVLGAVHKPGVLFLRGPTTLLEVLSLAGGLKDDAGYTLTVTRQQAQGEIPLPNCSMDSAGLLSVAQVDLDALMSSADANSNIEVRPRDTIHIPRGDLVYVLGQVRKPGGFVLRKKNISVLEALAMAEGFDVFAETKNARILRAGTAGKRFEEVVNLKALLQGAHADPGLRPNDILYVPDNKTARVTTRALETALNITTGVLIWRR